MLSIPLPNYEWPYHSQQHREHTPYPYATQPHDFFTGNNPTHLLMTNDDEPFLPDSAAKKSDSWPQEPAKLPLH